jgi:hypothetical protein
MFCSLYYVGEGVISQRRCLLTLAPPTQQKHKLTNSRIKLTQGACCVEAAFVASNTMLGVHASITPNNTACTEVIGVPHFDSADLLPAPLARLTCIVVPMRRRLLHHRKVTFVPTRSRRTGARGIRTRDIPSRGLLARSTHAMTQGNQ